MRIGILLICLSLVIFASSSSAQLPSNVSSNGIVAWWGFNGDVQDGSGGGHDGIIKGATLTADRFGQPSSAFNFYQDTIAIYDSTDFDLPQFTVSGWVKNDTTLGNYQTMFNNFISNSAYFGYWLGIYQNKACLSIGDGVGAWFDLTSDSTVNDNQWHMLTATYDGDSCKIYLDGSIANADTFNIVNGTASVSIGSSSVVTETYYGDLDDIGVWNRVLSQTEIDFLYYCAPTSTIITEFACQTYVVPSASDTLYASGTYIDTLASVTGCDSLITIQLTINNTSGNIMGHVSNSLDDIDSGKVLLFLYDELNAGWDTVSWAPIDSSGNYLFNNIDTSTSYVMLAMPDQINYPNNFNTYYPDQYMWENADSVSVICGQAKIANITLTEYDLQPGPADIEGYVYYYGSNKAGTDPIPGLSVVLVKTPPGGIVAQTETDINGYYKFANIDSGSYCLYMNYPGLPLLETYCVELGYESDSVLLNANFWIDSLSGVYTHDSLVVSAISELVIRSTIVVYPNPANGSLVYLVAGNLNDADIDYRIIVQDAFGRVVYSETIYATYGRFSHQLDVAKFASGLYTIVMDGNGSTLLTRLVVE